MYCGQPCCFLAKAWFPAMCQRLAGHYNPSEIVGQNVLLYSILECSVLKPDSRPSRWWEVQDLPRSILHKPLSTWHGSAHKSLPTTWYFSKMATWHNSNSNFKSITFICVQLSVCLSADLQDWDNWADQSSKMAKVCFKWSGMEQLIYGSITCQLRGT